MPCILYIGGVYLVYNIGLSSSCIETYDHISLLWRSFCRIIPEFGPKSSNEIARQVLPVQFQLNIGLRIIRFVQTRSDIRYDRFIRQLSFKNAAA